MAPKQSLKMAEQNETAVTDSKIELSNFSAKIKLSIMIQKMKDSLQNQSL
jgi:hypothetical protein